MGTGGAAIWVLAMVPKSVVWGLVPKSLVEPFRSRTPVLESCSSGDVKEDGFRWGLERGFASLRML